MTAVAEQAQITAVPAYLDLAEPDLGAAVRQLAEAGHTTAVVVPLPSPRRITPPWTSRRR